MTELTLGGLTPQELEAARESLLTLYEMRDEYVKAKRYLDSVELQMAQRYDTVNSVLNQIKEQLLWTRCQSGKEARNDGSDEHS